MRWNTIYVTESIQDSSKKVLRIHDIGDASDVRMEVHVHALKFDDPTILAIVSEEHAIEVAQSLSQKLGLQIEGLLGGLDPIEQTPDRDMHNAFKR